MYDELIKNLRHDSASALQNCDFDFVHAWMLEAADAIEAMDYELKSLYKLLGTHPDPRGENGEAGVKCIDCQRDC